MNTPRQAPNLAVSRREVLLRAIAQARSALHDAQSEVSTTTSDRQLSIASASVLPAVTQSLEQVQGLLSILADDDNADIANFGAQLTTKKRKLENARGATAVVSPGTEERRAVVGGKTLRHLHRLQLSNAVHVSPMDTLGVDVLIIILSFLEWESIMLARVCRRLKEASTLTPVGDVLITKCLGQCLEGNLSKLATVLPGIEHFHFEEGTIIRNGKSRRLDGPLALQCFDVDLSSLRTSCFRNLKELDLYETNLNGSYPAIFKLLALERLEVGGNPHLRCDLSDLQGLPNLTHAMFSGGVDVTGSLSSLGHLQDKLQCLELIGCSEVEGSLMDLSSFQKLRRLTLTYSSEIVGDIREIRTFHFPSLESLRIRGTSIFGGSVPRIAEGRSIAMAWKTLLQERGNSFPCCAVSDGINLSPSSGENYFYGPHFVCHKMDLVRFGDAFGFQWVESSNDPVPAGLHSCDIVWIDPPSPGYLPSFFAAQSNSMYRGLAAPPGDEESRRSLMAILLFEVFEAAADEHGYESDGSSSYV